MRFIIGQTVEFTKDFPTLGVCTGEHRIVVARAEAIPISKRCPKGIRERYGLQGLEHVRIPVEYLREVS